MVGVIAEFPISHEINMPTRQNSILVVGMGSISHEAIQHWLGSCSLVV